MGCNEPIHGIRILGTCFQYVIYTERTDAGLYWVVTFTSKICALPSGQDTFVQIGFPSFCFHRYCLRLLFVPILVELPVSYFVTFHEI